MAHDFYRVDRETRKLIPESVDEYVPENCMVRYLDQAVREFDLSHIESTYSLDGPGRKAFSPHTLLAIISWSYMHGVTSSRKIEERCRYDLRWQYITGERIPDHSTLAAARKEYLPLMKRMIVHTLYLCAKAGLVKVGVFALDGTKLKGNASLDANRTEEAIGWKIDELMAKAEEEDALEPAGDSTLSESLLEEAARLEVIKEGMRELREHEASLQADKVEEWEARERETGKRPAGRRPKDPGGMPAKERKVNLTDPDSAPMKTRQGYVQGYNGQVMAACAEGGEQIVVAGSLSAKANDVQQLEGMLEELRSNLEAALGAPTAPGAVVADAGYWSEANSKLDGDGCELFIATRNGRKLRGERREEPPPRGRPPANLTSKEKMSRRMASKRGRKTYRLRSVIEALIGQLKTCQNAGQLRMRGLEECEGEWLLHLAVHNLRKLFQWQSRGSPGLGFA